MLQVIYFGKAIPCTQFMLQYSTTFEIQELNTLLNAPISSSFASTLAASNNNPGKA